MRRFICLLSLLFIAVCAFAQHKPEINVWVSKDVAPSTKIRVNINTRNLPVVHMAAYKIDGESWLRRAAMNRARPGVIGHPLQEWNATIAAKGQNPNPNQADTFYSRQINLPKMAPGVYLISVTGGGTEAWAVVNVTHLAVLIKRSPLKMVVWVTDAIVSKVVPQARVNVYTQKGDLVHSYTTKPDGSIQIPSRPGSEVLVVTRGKDYAGLRTGAPDPDGRLLAHFQTDRPIYRPGQIVYFKSILRRTLGQGYKVIAQSPCTIELRDPKDNPLDRVQTTSNGMGSVNGQFEIPGEGMTGPYTLVLSNGKDKAYQTITVAEYRKPEFKVDVAPLKKRYLAGETVEFQVTATYYFGAPVQQAAVHYQVRRNSMPFYEVDPNEGWFYGGDGNLYARDTYDANPFVAEDTVYTDALGRVTINVPSDKAPPDSSYSITCTVQDSSRRQVEGGGSVPVYEAGIRLSLRTEVQYATLGSLIPITIRAVDLDRKPAAAKVALRLVKSEWSEKAGKDVERVLVETTVQVPASGKLTYNIPAREEGDLILYAMADDGTGRKTHASTSIWVAGNYKPPTKEKPQPTVDIKLDKRVYVPGDVAKAFVSTNNPGSPLIVVVEGGDIWDYIVITSPKAGQIYQIKTHAQMSPNAYVTVSQWVKNQLVSANIILPVPDPAKALTVQAIPDRKDYRPGDKATYTIRTLSKSGKPVSAEVSLAIVDEAIYALSPDITPDPYRFFWGQRQNWVASFETAPEEMSGGAYQRVNTVAPLRQRFEDTAYWNATVSTGPTGTAKVTVELPGNLTSWRATARGVTMETSVGATTANVVANRPVMLRLATPRQMVQGDKVTLIGTIDNRSDAEHEFDVSLVSEGVAVSGQATQRIRVAAKKQAKVEWQLDATKLPESGQGVLTGQVVALDVSEQTRADFSDALEVKLPIVPAGIRERVVVGGVLAKESNATLTLPDDRIEPASSVKVEIAGGLGALMRASADRVLRYPRWGSVGAANQLVAAASIGLPSTAKEVRESLALLSKNQVSNGWGWWENSPSDPIITSKVLSSLGIARRAKLTVYENLLRLGQFAAIERYNQTNLWEHRALLAAALMMSAEPKAGDRVDEVLRRGQNLSPYAKLKLAEAMAVAGRKDASELVKDALKDASLAPNSAFVPSGDGVGWSASDVETTAQALAALVRIGEQQDLQQKLARWLVLPDNDYWRSTDEDTAVTYALSLYTKEHPDPTRIGEVELVVNGTVVKTTPAKIGDVMLATIPRSLLKSGDNSLVLRRTEGGEAFYTVDAAIYRPGTGETAKGVRVLRRFEVRNDAGIWVELRRNVRPGEPVRCTVIAWGDDIPDAMRIVEPTPAGFEFIDGEASAYTREEVRDGAVVHYLVNQGEPQVFRYYIRAEAEGTLTALPATAEYIRRPADRGQSNGDKLEVRIGK